MEQYELDELAEQYKMSTEKDIIEELNQIKQDILDNHNNIFPEPHKWKLDSFELKQTCENYLEYAKLQAELKGLKEGRQIERDEIKKKIEKVKQDIFDEIYNMRKLKMISYVNNRNFRTIVKNKLQELLNSLGDENGN